MSGSIYGEYEASLHSVLERMLTAVRTETGGVPYEHLLGRVKTDESMRAKCRLRGLPEDTHSALSVLSDAIGVRVVCLFIDDIYRMAEAIRALDGVEVLAEKDYIRDAKPNGYRSYHMILAATAPETDPEGRTPGRWLVEVQLRTIAMDTWASLEHEIRYKRDNPAFQLIGRELKRTADELAACDVNMQAMRDLIRGTLAEENGEGPQ